MTHKLLKEHWLVACASHSLGKKPYTCEILGIANLRMMR